jgi:hypothetical protein
MAEVELRRALPILSPVLIGPRVRNRIPKAWSPLAPLAKADAQHFT